VGPPRVDRARLELYRRWHADREAFRAWESSELDRQGYATTFAFPHVAAREFAYFLDDATTPCAIGLHDETGSTLSAVYFFYDPALKALSLGVINVLHAIERAKALGITHVYLGFLVEDCPSLAYKAGFRPAERLVGRPDDDEAPLWTAYAKSRREADELR
jgi:arginine-tRNA-protein transferase